MSDSAANSSPLGPSRIQSHGTFSRLLPTACTGYSCVFRSLSGPGQLAQTPANWLVGKQLVGCLSDSRQVGWLVEESVVRLDVLGVDREFCRFVGQVLWGR